LPVRDCSAQDLLPSALTESSSHPSVADDPPTSPFHWCTLWTTLPRFPQLLEAFLKVVVFRSPFPSAPTYNDFQNLTGSRDVRKLYQRTDVIVQKRPIENNEILVNIGKKIDMCPKSLHIKDLHTKK
tara:strand:- start:6633 stop:7013 length:381 start_codon:yes stop_codon:yes gene_type:complete